MTDIAIDPPLDASEAWIAAYAMGLAYSESSDEQRLTDLIEASRGCLALIAAAHRRLDGTVVADASIGEEALRLLERALDHVSADQPGPPARDLREAPRRTQHADRRSPRNGYRAASGHRSPNGG